MAAIIQGTKEQFPKTEKIRGIWYFRAFYKPVEDTNEFTMVEVSLINKDIDQAVAQLNDFAKNVIKTSDRVSANFFTQPEE